MSKAYDALMRELEAETSSPETPETTPAPAETTPAEEPKPAEEPTPAEEPKPSEEPKPAEPSPSEEPKPTEEPPKKPSEFSPEERATHAFNRQLAKERQKHQAELEEIKASFQKQIDELRKSTKQPEPKKSRADFGSDDEFIDYLVRERYETERAKDLEKAAKEAEERAKQQAEQEENQRILQSEQAAWLSNVDSAFGEDAKGKQAFLSRLQTCLDKGLGTVLDACPVAADYLLHNANGPRVMEKMLADRATFERVFNDRTSPMDQYYELRSIEAELKAQPSVTPAPQSAAPTPTPQTLPHLGKPGKSGNAATPDIFSDPNEMRAFLRGR